eukprot:5474712-Prymnesium_polylepis.1
MITLIFNPVDADSHSSTCANAEEDDAVLVAEAPDEPHDEHSSPVPPDRMVAPVLCRYAHTPQICRRWVV